MAQSPVPIPRWQQHDVILSVHVFIGLHHPQEALELLHRKDSSVQGGIVIRAHPRPQSSLLCHEEDSKKSVLVFGWPWTVSDLFISHWKVLAGTIVIDEHRLLTQGCGHNHTSQKENEGGRELGLYGSNNSRDLESRKRECMYRGVPPVIIS